MNTNKSRFLAFSLAMACFAAFGQAFALERNTKMGKPTQEELQMTQYDQDPEAAAVVLYAGERVFFDIVKGDFRINYERTLRIKVLREEGVDAGDFLLRTYVPKNSNRRESITGLKASTYNLENGKVVRSKLTDDLRNSERVDDRYIHLKFSMPNVKVGSIIEVEYTKTSEFYWNIETWRAQRKFPTFYTTYELAVPEWIQMSSSQTGIAPVQVTRTQDNFKALIEGGGALSCLSEVTKAVGTELPGLSTDGYVFCSDDYCTKIEHELRGYTIPGALYKSFSNSWSKVSETLMQDEDFSRPFRMDNPLKEEQMALALPDSLSVEEKVTRLRELLLQNYTWNGNYGIYGLSQFKVRREESLNGGSLNFVLRSMLRQAGIKAYPMLMSRRTAGRLPYTHPSIESLNTMALYVASSDSTYFVVDACSNNYPVGTLRTSMLVDRVLVFFGEKETDWVDLSSVCRENRATTVTATLSADGRLTGTCNMTYRGLSAGIERASYNNLKDSAEYLDKIASRYEVEIDSFAVTGMKNLDDAAGETFGFSRQMETAGDRIYLNMALFTELNSPFKAETRTLPVEYGAQMVYRGVVSVDIPEGYRVEEMPKAMRLNLPEKSQVYKCSFSLSGRKLVMVYQLQRNKMIFLPEEYEYLRDFSAQVENSVAQMVTLVKE